MSADRQSPLPSALPGMLGLALTFTLLVLSGCQSQAPVSSYPVLLRSGAPLRLPVSLSIQTRAASVQWKVQLRSTQAYLLLTWKRFLDWDGDKWKCNPHFKNTRCFIMRNETLVIEAAQPQDSGIYLLEATHETGEAETYRFSVSVFDPLGTPRLQQEQQEALDGGKCRVTLSCSISRGGNVSYGDVSYTWFRGSERIPGPRHLSTLEDQIDGGPHTYTCEVNNLVSTANQTLRLSSGCWSALQEISLLPLWIVTVSLAVVLLLGTGALTWVCVRNRRRKRAELSLEAPLTVYEDVDRQRVQSSQEQREWDSPMAGTTIYSMILSQPSASTSQRTEKTLYSVVQPSQKSGSKKRKQSPSLSCTVYDEVGKLQAKAQSPVLTCKELENFRVYC